MVRGVHGVWFAHHLLAFAWTRDLPGSADRPDR